MQANEDPTLGGAREEVLAYRKVLANEVRSHRLLSKMAVVSGGALIALGLAVVFYYDVLGWLLILFGTLRALNSIFDLHRKDDLQRKLKLLEEEFGTRERS